jgi:hypothetical protein
MLLLFLCPKVIIIHNKHHTNLIDRSNNDAVHNRDVVLGGLAAKAEMDEQHPDVVLRNDPTAGLDLDQVRADEARAERRAQGAAPDEAGDDGLEGLRRILEDMQRRHEQMRRIIEDFRRRREDRRNLQRHGQAPPPPPPAPQPPQAPPPPAPAPQVAPQPPLAN